MRIRELKLSDAERMLEWMKNPQINYWYCFQPEEMSLHDVHRFIEQAEQGGGQQIHYAIADDKDEYIGTVSLKNINKIRKDAEYAIVLRSKAQGKGISAEATNEILKIGFEQYKLDKIYLNVLAENARANAFYRKYGFVFDRTEVNGIQHRGVLKNLNWYFITKEKLYDK